MRIKVTNSIAVRKKKILFFYVKLVKYLNLISLLDDGRNKNNIYLCARSAVIIPAEKRCNGIRDCQLSDDELDCCK